MAIRYYSPGKRKAPSRVVRPTRARDEALAKQMSQAFSLEFGKGMQRLRQNVSSNTLANAYLEKDYSKLFKSLSTSSITRALERAVEQIGLAQVEGGARAKLLAPAAEPIRYDVSNERVRDYMLNRQGLLIQKVNEDFRGTVSTLVSRRFASGLSDSGIAMGLLDETKREGVAGYVLKNSIGLDEVRAQQLANRAASGEYTKEQLAAFESKLHVARAETIARTEVSYAMNYGQVDVWQEAQEEGLLGPNAMKVWSTDANPCFDCQPMDGIAVGMNEDFLLPSGIQVPCPPAHPRCLCICQAQVDENDDAPLNSEEVE